MEIRGCLLPEDRRYDLESDTWWFEDGEPGVGRLGILGALGAFAGPFRSFAFRPVGPVVGRGRSIATVESVRFTGAIRLPFDAELLARNERLIDRPRLLNDDPYAEGWVARLRAVRPGDPGRLLEEAPAIAGRLEERIVRERIRCWPQTPDLELYEIGLECSAVLTQLNEALAPRKPGEAVLLVTDDPTSPIEMVRWSDETGHTLVAGRAEGTLHHFLVRKEADPHPRRRGADGARG